MSSSGSKPSFSIAPSMSKTCTIRIISANKSIPVLQLFKFQMVRIPAFPDKHNQHHHGVHTTTTFTFLHSHCFSKSQGPD